jgi:drug/metabolite transporter (DMT)-like permease
MQPAESAGASNFQLSELGRTQFGSWLLGEPAPQWTSPLALGSLFYQSVVIAFFSYLAWFWLLRHYPAARVSAFTFLTPVLGLLAGVVLLDEQLTGSLLIGLAGVAVGLWLVNRPARIS